VSVLSSGEPAHGPRLRKALAGWILAAGLTDLGLTAIPRRADWASAGDLAGHRAGWRRYARDVAQRLARQRARPPGFVTETAIAQHARARIAVDLVRFRARHTDKGDSPVG